jgi:hypothetical protein
MPEDFVEAQIEKYTKLYTGYTGVYPDLKYIVEDVEKSKNVTRKVEDRYNLSEG